MTSLLNMSLHDYDSEKQGRLIYKYKLLFFCFVFLNIGRPYR